MPNFWTRTTQFFDEAFKGPRTIDVEFNDLIKEMSNIENGMLQLKQVLLSIKNFSSAYKLYFSSISESLRNIFSRNSPFCNLIENILEVYKQLEIRCEVYTQAMVRLIPKTTEWSNFFQQASHPLQNRENARKEFDHYDGKMEGIYRRKSKKGNYFERNQEKFCQAAINYIEMSEEAYHVISDIMNRRYEMINPVLLEFVIEQREFLRTEGEISMKLNKIEDKFTMLQKKDLIYVRQDYNAGKYIRGGLLLKKNNPTNKRRLTTEDLIKKSFIFGKQKFCDEEGFELHPTKDKIVFKRRALMASSKQVNDFYWIPDFFSGVSNRLAKQTKKDQDSIQRSFTEPNGIPNNKTNQQQGSSYYYHNSNGNADLFADFF